MMVNYDYTENTLKTVKIDRSTDLHLAVTLCTA